MLLTYGCKNWLLCARCALTATDQAGCLAFHAINMRTREGERCAGAGEGGCGKICWNSHDLLASARKLNRNPAIAISIHSFKHQRSHKAHAPAGSLSLSDVSVSPQCAVYAYMQAHINTRFDTHRSESSANWNCAEFHSWRLLEAGLIQRLGAIYLLIRSDHSIVNSNMFHLWVPVKEDAAADADYVFWWNCCIASI